MVTTAIKQEWLFIAAVISAALFAPPVAADDRVIEDKNGNVFMEEEAPKQKAPPPRRVMIPRIIESSSGQSFMQEESPANNDPLTRPYHAPADFSNVGVPTDPAGNIVPLIQRDGPPIMPLFSQFQQFNQYAQAPIPMNSPGQLIGAPAFVRSAIPYGYPLNQWGSPYGAYGAYAPLYSQPASLSWQLGNLNVAIGPNFPAYSQPIGVPYGLPGTTPFAYPNIFGARSAGFPLGGFNTGFPYGGYSTGSQFGSYSNSSVFGPLMMNRSSSWRSF
jgi:hypothetical protein